MHNGAFRLRLDLSLFIDAIQQILGTDVGGHNQDRILEIDSFAGRIRDTSIIQNLQQDVKYIRVRFLNLIEEDNGIRFAPYCLGQLTALVISDISWRRSDQTGNGMFLHVFTHIDTNHVVLIVKQCLRQRFCKLCLADTGRT